MKNLIKRVIRKGRRMLQKPDAHLGVVLPLNFQNITRLLYLKRMIDAIRNIDGDVVECGVGHGKSFFMMACILKEEMQSRKLWGFDSFEGFPEPAPQDASFRMPKKGEWGDTSMRLIDSLIRDGGLDTAYIRSTISLIPGFFSESLSKYDGKGIALLHIDADLYASYVDVLKQLYPKVVPGGLVILDEYLGIEHVKFPGPYQAIQDYFGKQPPPIERDAVTGKFHFYKPR